MNRAHWHQGGRIMGCMCNHPTEERPRYDPDYSEAFFFGGWLVFCIVIVVLS